MNKQKLSAEIEEAGIDAQLRADNFERFRGEIVELCAKFCETGPTFER